MDEFLTACENLRPEDLYGYHIVPAAWDPAHNPAPFPFPKTYIWHSLQKLCEQYAVRQTIVCATPFSWQLEPLVYAVAHTLPASIAVVSPKNLTLIKPYSEQSGVDLIILAPEHLEDVLAVLSKTTRAPKALLIIHRDAKTLRESVPTAALPYSILHELHAVPGLPLFSHYGDTSSGDLVFERNESCTWDESGHAVTLPDVCGVWPAVQIPYRMQQTERGYVFV